MLVLWMLCLVAGVTSQSMEGDEGGGMAETLNTFCSGQNNGMPHVDCFAPVCTFVESCGTIFDSLTSLGDSSSNGVSQPPTAAQLHGICDSGCLGRMFTVFGQLASCMEKASGQPMDMGQESIQPQMDLLCSQNPLNGEYCSVAVVGMVDSHPEYENVSMLNATAHDQQVMCGALSELGCCLSTFLEYNSTNDVPTNDDSPDEFNKKNVLSTCQWMKLPPPCGKMGETKKNIDISIKSDILWSDWSLLSGSEKKAAQFAAAQDLKSTLGIDLLAATFSEDADGKVQLNFNVDSTNDASLQQQIQTALGSQPPNWSTLAAAIPGVTSVTTSNADVKEGDVTHILPDPSSSHRKMPGFFLLYSVLFLWRFAFF